LKDHIFVGGDHPSNDDNCLINKFFHSNQEPCAKTYPYLHSWYNLLAIYPPGVRDQWVAHQEHHKGAEKGGEKKGKPVETKKEEPKADDEMDLFGDDSGPSMEELKKKKEEETGAKKKKEAPIAKSIVIYDVKIWEPEGYDYDGLAKRILALQIDGLIWKTEYKLSDLAFGVKKVVIGCVVEDDKCGVDDVAEKIAETFPDDVQSVDIATFNKI